MGKTVSVMNKRVKDLGGLYIDLMKQSFAVKNVGSDRGGTYVYLEDEEEKDPTALVVAWADKPAPELSKREVRRRKEELDGIPTHAPMLQTDPGEMTVVVEPPPEPEEEEQPASQEGFVKKFFRKLFT